jgi:hypothetical protein
MYELHRIRLIADAQPEHAGAAADLVLALIDGSPTGRLLGRARDHGAEMLALVAHALAELARGMEARGVCEVPAWVLQAYGLTLIRTGAPESVRVGRWLAIAVAASQR